MFSTTGGDLVRPVETPGGSWRTNVFFIRNEPDPAGAAAATAEGGSLPHIGGCVYRIFSYSIKKRFRLRVRMYDNERNRKTPTHAYT